jgi:hypothetical protein
MLTWEDYNQEESAAAAPEARGGSGGCRSTKRGDAN